MFSTNKESELEVKDKNYTFFHNLIVRDAQYCGRDSFNTKTSNQRSTYTNPKTSFYMCKRMELNKHINHLETCLIKRLAYRKTNKVDDRGKIIYNDRECKNYDQISTEYNCYKLLQNSNRAIQMKDFIHENTKSKEDSKFFYNFLKLNDRRS